jgi:hypothetical protein
VNFKRYETLLEDNFIVSPALLQESINCKPYGTLVEENFTFGPALLKDSMNCKRYGTSRTELYFILPKTGIELTESFPKMMQQRHTLLRVFRTALSESYSRISAIESYRSQSVLAVTLVRLC